MSRFDNNKGRIATTLAIAALLCLTGCAAPVPVFDNATLSPTTQLTRDLLQLPPPKGRVVTAVYGFRDQTGQYKPSPDSSFSSEVTQGAASMLVDALRESGWFMPVERENLQDLLTERKIVRALETPADKAKPVEAIGALTPANVIIEGGIVAYDTNLRTGGLGVNYLGIGGATQYRVDQVTIALRAVDIRNGQILNSVSTTKTVYSYELTAGVFKFVGYQNLLQVDAGLTYTEPQQLCVREAIEAAVMHLIVQGISAGTWNLKDAKDWNNPVIQNYAREDTAYLKQVALPESPQGAVKTSNGGG
ncbi:curli production assembly/transport protein CsgG [Trinickia violacea]|uniref:Curli production assembly/transport protein CsgG n=1 Tax=Trinickia violacea TaxID=2571746 RepID=A0A4P8J2N6_9BURK|nr:CsgG/HfaB family protein [Trinickia violacea]QCP52679.1 curli production assembly/transport protein CsgG [Trinickia violacea]